MTSFSGFHVSVGHAALKEVSLTGKELKATSCLHTRRVDRSPDSALMFRVRRPLHRRPADSSASKRSYRCTSRGGCLLRCNIWPHLYCTISAHRYRLTFSSSRRWTGSRSLLISPSSGDVGVSRRVADLQNRRNAA